MIEKLKIWVEKNLLEIQGIGKILLLITTMVVIAFLPLGNYVNVINGIVFTLSSFLSIHYLIALFSAIFIKYDEDYDRIMFKLTRAWFLIIALIPLLGYLLVVFLKGSIETNTLMINLSVVILTSELYFKIKGITGEVGKN